MISYKDAVTEILNNICVLTPEEKPLSRCLGQVTAENIYSEIDLPQVASCGPDGYALRSADIIIFCEGAVSLCQMDSAYRDRDRISGTAQYTPGAGFLSAMASANSLTILPPGVNIDAGDKLRVLPLA